MNGEQFREAAHAAIEEIIQHFNTISSKPVVPSIEPGYLRPLVPTSAPNHPEPWSKIQPDIESKIMPGLTQWQSPKFMAYFPAGVTYPSMLGELYSAAFTAPAFNWLCSPACTELEIIVMDWLAQALGLPDCFLSAAASRSGRSTGGGTIQGSASEAVATVIVAARERHLRAKAMAEGLVEDTPEWEDRTMEMRTRLVVLGSDQTHSCTAKGARIAGVRYRAIPTRLEENLAMTGDALRRMLQQCERDGLEPFFLTATLGTTNSCAVDRFAEIKAVLREKEAWKKIWVHIDAAFAGSALVTEEWQHVAQEFAEGVDSFNVNMAKWLLVNFDASCLFITNALDLTNALDITPAYLRNPSNLTTPVTDFRNWGIPLGRRFRALKVWFVMRTYGLSGMKAHIRKGINNGVVFADLTRTRDDLFEIVTGPAFGLTTLRVRGLDEKSRTNSTPLSNGATPGQNEKKASQDTSSGVSTQALTHKVCEKINAGGELFLTSSVLGGVVVIRAVSGNPLAEEKYVRRAFEILVNVTEEVLAEERKKMMN
ncbi:aromatic-L-amino acid decarboxylase [Histoplasma capsulatum G186AR]|uniref:Aromatic-L-amino acid decarboxylase n=2 Tax=Ajellomyces capsulatus TaxID=5037 RepID=C0NZ25_AJECG|nr:aromatic-L-amino acid decarboxylase [Histoplasma capsulatum G186AR]EEH03465.1 aromatic-L-amino acid decarboxylase [Histoplasma capsulatum G186AR]KAG5295876.1 aromatic-L-amino acid decarboxylase [Histoplasma capsulatum]QSS73859.1 aromatic-L-amino acid decarboxylase [Histoplasma capsulatum G186AR]